MQSKTYAGYLFGDGWLIDYILFLHETDVGSDQGPYNTVLFYPPPGYNWYHVAYTDIEYISHAFRTAGFHYHGNLSFLGV